MITIIKIIYIIANKTLNSACWDVIPKDTKEAFKVVKKREFCQMWGVQESEVEINLIYKEK